MRPSSKVGPAMAGPTGPIPLGLSYENTVSLPSLKTKILCQTRFATTAATVAMGAIIWKAGFNVNVLVLGLVSVLVSVSRSVLV